MGYAILGLSTVLPSEDLSFFLSHQRPAFSEIGDLAGNRVASTLPPTVSSPLLVHSASDAACTRWWLLDCLMRQARTHSRRRFAGPLPRCLFYRDHASQSDYCGPLPNITMSLPEAPGISISYAPILGIFLPICRVWMPTAGFGWFGASSLATPTTVQTFQNIYRRG